MSRKYIGKKLRFEVFKRDNFTCQYCGRMAPNVILEIDHINPVKNDGTNDILNLVTSCFECNRGKGKNKLTENQELKQQQEQLKLLNEKRKQLKMLIDWKQELEDFENNQVKEIENIFSDINMCFSNFGSLKIKNLIKKYGFIEVYESSKISKEKYYNQNKPDESREIIFNYISRICSNREQQKSNPQLFHINYLVKILKNRLSYLNEFKLKQFLRENFLSERDFETLKKEFIAVKNWSNLIKFLEEYYLCEF